MSVSRWGANHKGFPDQGGFSAKLLTGWLIDGSGGPAKRNQVIDINAGRVESITPLEEIPETIPGLLNYSSATVIPGLIDSHVHLFLPEIAADDHAEKDVTDGGRGEYPIIGERLLRLLSRGVVAVRDGGDRFGALWHYKAAHSTDRLLPIAINTPGSALYLKGRYGAFIGKAVVNGDDLPDVVCEMASRVDHIKIINSGINSIKNYGFQSSHQFSPVQMQAAVAAAGGLNRHVMVHANGIEPVKISVEAGCQTIEHGYFMGRDNLMRLRDRQVTWVPTAVPMSALSRIANPGTREADVSKKTLDHQLEQIAFAKQLVVRVAAGSDAGSSGVDHRDGLIGEILLIQSAGYKIEEAIACATGNAARLLVSQIPGRIEAGSPVSLVIVPGSPESLPYSLNHVWRVYGSTGCIYQNSSKQSQA